MFIVNAAAKLLKMKKRRPNKNAPFMKDSEKLSIMEGALSCPEKKN